MKHKKLFFVASGLFVSGGIVALASLFPIYNTVQVTSSGDEVLSRVMIILQICWLAMTLGSVLFVVWVALQLIGAHKHAKKGR